MRRPIDPDVPGPRLHPERIQEAVVVIRKAVALVNSHIKLVRALYEIQAVNRERDVSLATQPFRIHLLDVSIRSIATHPIGVEQSDPESEVVCFVMRAHLEAHVQRLSRVKDERRLPLAI